MLQVKTCLELSRANNQGKRMSSLPKSELSELKEGDDGEERSTSALSHTNFSRTE